MKKKYLYIFSIIVFFVAIIGIISIYKKKEKEKENRIYSILSRKGSAANSKEFQEVQKKANQYLSILQEQPTDLNASLRLAALYIQEARETGNYLYYDQAAMKYVNNVLKSDSANFNALVYKSLLYLSQHHFAEGLAEAKKAQQINPHNAYVYGLMVDGNVEMGNYDSAVANADKMVSIRPDLTSYSRVSYLREIFGDYKAAIEAMKMAVDAGGRGDEHTEWTRVQLAHLYEKTGDYSTAEGLYNESLSMRPDYPYALAGLGRVALAAKDYKKAIAHFEKADQLIEDNSMKEELIDIYRLVGQGDKADQLAQQVIDNLSKDSKAADVDENVGHYADRELAYAYLKVKDVDNALEHAMLEYNRRPENIDVNETVAWVYYAKGEYTKAVPYIKTALKTNSKNPVLLSRAGLIYYKAGEKQMAKTMLKQAAGANYHVGTALQAEARDAMLRM